MQHSQNEISTKTIIKDLIKSNESSIYKKCEPCKYEVEKDNWLDARFLKVAGVIIGLLSPLFVWIVISIFTMRSEIAVMQEKQQAIIELTQDIKSIRNDISTIKTDIAVLKVKENK